MEPTLWIEFKAEDLNFDLFSVCLHQLDPKSGHLLLVFKGGYSLRITDKTVAKDLSAYIKQVKADLQRQLNSPIVKA